MRERFIPIGMRDAWSDSPIRPLRLYGFNLVAVNAYRHGLPHDAKSAPKQKVASARFAPQRKALLKLLGDGHQRDLGWEEER